MTVEINFFNFINMFLYFINHSKRKKISFDRKPMSWVKQAWEDRCHQV